MPALISALHRWVMWGQGHRWDGMEGHRWDPPHPVPSCPQIRRPRLLHGPEQPTAGSWELPGALRLRVPVSAAVGQCDALGLACHRPKALSSDTAPVSCPSTGHQGLAHSAGTQGLGCRDPVPCFTAFSSVPVPPAPGRLVWDCGLGGRAGRGNRNTPVPPRPLRNKARRVTSQEAIFLPAPASFRALGSLAESERLPMRSNPAPPHTA